MAKAGSGYEIFVGAVQDAIIQTDGYAGLKNVRVEVNKIIIDNTGCKRQFDVYWEFEVAGEIYRNVFECKDYSSKIVVEKVDALIGKIKDIPGLRGFFATKQGYQSGAKTRAKANNIGLMVIRNFKEEADTVDSEGNPLIMKVVLRMVVLRPPEIESFVSYIDKDWMEKHFPDDAQVGNFNAMEDQIFIEDVARGETYSLHQLRQRLDGPEGEFGYFEKEFSFDDAYIVNEGVRLKLRGFKVGFRVEPPIENISEIDFRSAVLGVVEDVLKGTKRMVMRPNAYGRG